MRVCPNAIKARDIKFTAKDGKITGQNIVSVNNDKNILYWKNWISKKKNFIIFLKKT